MSQEPPELTRHGAAQAGPAIEETSIDETSLGASEVPLEGTSGSGGGRQGGRHRRQHGYRWIGEWAAIIAIALLAAFLVRTYVLETFYVPSTSMWPTLKAGDRIVVNKLYGAIHAGTIVVFRRPPAEDCGGPIVPDLVKRVIGLPGQTVSAKNGQVYITGRLLAEPWLPKGPHTRTTMTGSFKVPTGDYFVMGDNRVNSCDSRTWGPVKSSYIVGKVFLIIWPPGRWRYF